MLIFIKSEILIILLKKLNVGKKLIYKKENLMVIIYL